MQQALPIHPRTGLRAVGFWRGGRPIWPIAGGSGDSGDPPAGDPPAPDPPAPDPTKTDPPAGDPPKQDPKLDEPLGEGGLKALQAERKAREELEKQIKGLAPLQKLADVLTGGDPAKANDDPVQLLNDRVTGLEGDVSTEREGRWRAEVAHEKGLTPEQAARLVGATKEELAADADALKALFPSSGTTPRPDPSQGPRGGGVDIDAQITEAQKAGDYRKVITLQNQKLAEQRVNQ